MMDVTEGWKRTCQVLLGEEIGEMDRYEGYLGKYVYQMEERKSAISGKEVSVSSEDFCEGARFIAYDENEAYSGSLASKMKLGINEMKDIDSILAALEGQVCYAGSIVLGNSSRVTESNRVTNGHFVHSSTDVYDSKYVGHSSRVRYGEHIYGSNASGESRFIIKGFRHHRSSRCMEVHHAEHSMECYFCARIDGCQNCMFSFNQRSKSYVIGNLQLSKEEYLKLKAKLLEDISGTLEAKKSIPSIIEIIAGGDAAKGKEVRFLEPSPVPPETEKSFADCSRLLLGRKLQGIGSYRKWLFRHVPEPMKVKSAMSSKPVCVARLLFHEPLAGSVVTETEADELGKKSLNPEQVRRLGLSNASGLLQSIKLITPEIVIRKNVGNLDCGVIADAVGCYCSSECAYSKHCAYCAWPRESEHLFGSTTAFSSRFCMKCYNSVNLTRCFEVSDSNNCTDCYFCHNCENVHESMFCFNAKNLRHAIGNVEMGREKYLEAKKKVLAELGEELERKGSAELDIYSVGCHARR